MITPAAIAPEEVMRRIVARYSPPIVFGLRFLGPDNSDRARPWFTLKPSPIHDALARAITESGKNVLGIGPREFAKSRIGLTCDLFDACTLARQDFMVVGNSATLAEWQLSHIIDQIEHNRLLCDQFKITPGRVQKSDHFEIKVDGEKVTFFARGFDGSVRGFHVSRVRFDDIETTQDSAYVMAQNYEEIHGTFMGALSYVGDGAPAQIVYQCNLVSPHCTGQKLWESDAAQYPEYWERLRFHALSNDTTGNTDDVETGNSVWPEFRTREQLLAIRAQMNAGEAWAFEREYQNRIVSAANTIWTREMFERTYADLPERRHGVSRVYIDPAQSLADSGDETAITTWCKITDGPRVGEYCFVDARIAHLAPDEIAREAVRQYIGNGSADNPQCDALKLESKTKKGPDPLAALIKRYGAENNVNVNVDQLIPTQDKLGRSKHAVQVGRAGAISLPVNPSRDMQKCVNQMIQFTGKIERNMNAVDDGHDACVWGLIDLLPVERREEDRVPFDVDSVRSRIPTMGLRARGRKVA